MPDPIGYLKKEPYPMYINGQFVPSGCGDTFDVASPVTNETIAQVYRGGRADAQKAIRAARTAFDHGPWGRMTQLERSQLLLRAGEILARRQDEFIAIEGLNCGKLWPSLKYYELPSSIDAFQYAAGKLVEL